MNLDDVKRYGAFRRIHDFGAPSSSSSTVPSGNNLFWIPQLGEEIFIHFEPKAVSFIQNVAQPSDSLNGIKNFKYHQELNDPLTPSIDPWGSSVPFLQRAYVEFELHFDDNLNSGLVMTILADATYETHLSLDQDKLHGRFIITQAELEMRMV